MLLFLCYEYALSTIFDDNRTFAICGHTPTLSINGKTEIYNEGEYINDDCGLVFKTSGWFDQYPMNDMKDFYV